MSSNKDTIAKGVKYLAIALPLMFLGPFLITIGFKALNDGNYLWLIFGILISIVAIILAFFGVKTILTGLFQK
ncbi:MAG: hypothetical protein KUG51_00665 [Urechidicola sp.]|nr:hypothetical protein [Urechidicola sp.]